MKKQITQTEVLSQVRLLLDVVVRSALWMLERTGRNFKPIPEPGTVLKLDLSLSDKSLSENRLI